MAIQIPNPGTGNGASGDNEFVLWTKVKDNFSNTTHAASRLVGTANGNLVEMTAAGIAGAGIGGNIDTARDQAGGMPTGAYYLGAGMNYFGGGRFVLDVRYVDDLQAFRISNTINSNKFFLHGSAGSTIRNNQLLEGVEIYHTGNTTKEPTTGYLKAASPILHLLNDDLVKEHEAVEQDITVEKLGTGDYLIKGSTGLSNEGWNLSPPKDIHGNVLCMVEATEADGNINVKTYKRKFDFDTVAIVPDYDQPFDIPAGHSVDLRLNDLPQETQTEV